MIYKKYVLFYYTYKTSYHRITNNIAKHTFNMRLSIINTYMLYLYLTCYTLE